MSFYITTPLFYVNDLPHIGSAYPTMAADFIAGYMMQRGEDVCFLTGTDEHGQKIEKSAKANGKAPQDHCDYIAAEFKKLWEILDIHNSYFVRTSNDEHKSFVKDFFMKVYNNGDIYKGKYKGLYCVSCEDFWLEKDLDEVEIDGKIEHHCPVHKAKVEEYEQENYFFALSKYEDKLKKYIEDNPDFICPEYRKNEVLGWLKEGLRDFPISRVGIDWGIDLPAEDNHDNQKIYVWFDALLGYISGLGPDKDKCWAENSRVVHIIGKDILRFHAVYWPAMLMSAGYPLPSMVFGHGFLTKDGMKMGKTLGNVIDPVELTNDYGSDSVRFFFLRELVFGKDGDFTLENFVTKLNADLANNLGNLLNRCVNLAHKYYDGKIPDGDFDPDIKKSFEELEQRFIKQMEKFNSHAALDELFTVLSKVNAFINDAEPWKILKKTDDKAAAAKYIYTGLEACRQAAIYLAPICPNLANRITSQLALNNEDELSKMTRKQLLNEIYTFGKLSDQLTSATMLNEPNPVFNRIDIKDLTEVT